VVRGLSYARVALGLADVEPGNVALTADPNVVSCSGTYYFKTCPAVNPASEQIVHTPGVTATCASPCVEPLVPHRGTVGPPNYPDTYTWSVYVTKALSVPSAGAFRVTVIVSWTASGCSVTMNSTSALSTGHIFSGCVSWLANVSFGYKQVILPGSPASGFKEDVKCLREVATGSALPAPPAC